MNIFYNYEIKRLTVKRVNEAVYKELHVFVDTYM